MSSPSLEQLRYWQRNQEHDKIIEALDLETCKEAQKAVLCLALALSGNEAARSMLPEVARQNPTDPMWKSDVALVCLLAGEKEKSLNLLEEAVASPEATAVEFSRLGTVYLTMNELEKGREYYQEAIDRETGNGIWHNNLAGILVRQQKMEEALENYDRALKLTPDLEKAKQSRLNVLRALERTEEIVAELEKEIEINPEDIHLRLRLARAYDLDNKFTQAIQTLKEALLPVKEVEKPDKELPARDKSETPWAEQISLRMEMARIFTERSRHGIALHALNQVEELDPENPVQCYSMQATALSEMGRYDKALEKLDAAKEKIFEDNPEATLPLPLDMARAGVLNEKGDYEQAEEILRRLLETYPGNAQLLTQLGQTLLWTGKLDEAADCFEEASNINPMALAQMVNARRIPEDPKALEKMRQMADNPLMAEQARISMAFALSDLYEKQKDADNAWPYLELGNRLTDKQLGYSPEGFTKKVDTFKQVFTREFFAGQEPIGNSWPTPIFVVGMPRSGTTLTEQILCSHKDIFGAGELDLMGRLNQLMPKVLKDNRPFPVCIDKFTPHLRTEAARFYLKGLQHYDTEHDYVVDKMPHNFMQLGLIHLIFPQAKIIHIQRDPRDTALSNFQQNFKAKHGGMGFAFDLEKIALQINDYHRIMQHWREVLPAPVFEIKYEDLVVDQDTWSHKLLEFVGVDWDEQVMDFHKTERAVRTASVTQVRQPIYQTSKQKWRRYEKYLQPLLDNLDPTYMPEEYKE